MEQEKKCIITITRQFGSLGRPIAKLVSEKLNIQYYDRDIVEQASEQLCLPVSQIDQLEEKAEKATRNGFMRMMYPLGTQTSAMQNKIFEAQKNIMRFLAERESCIIVGRCSDFIFAKNPKSLHIYIYAPYEARLENYVNTLNLSEAEAKRMIQSVDQARDQYHMHYAGFLPNDPRFKNIMIDSSTFGTNETADFLADGIRRKFPYIFQK